jgi:hypothetical protein
MLVAAAYAAGFSVKRVAYDSYNAHLNISMQTVNAARGRERNSQIDGDRAMVHSMYAPATDFEPAYSG